MHSHSDDLYASYSNMCCGIEKPFAWKTTTKITSRNYARSVHKLVYIFPTPLDNPLPTQQNPDYNFNLFLRFLWRISNAKFCAVWLENFSLLLLVWKRERCQQNNLEW